MARPGACALAALLAIIAECTGGGGAYYGVEIGALSSLHHGVRGRVFAVDSRTLYLHDFHYDGEGPAAYFYVGNGKTPGGGGAGGVRLRDERGGTGPLRRYRGEGLTLALPDGRTLKDIKWLSVWCDDFSVNFGSAVIPRGLEPPRSVRAGALRGIHGVSSAAVVVVDAQTLLVPNFSYDGEAPDAKFWVGRGASPSPQGIRIPDEHGSEAPLRKYDNKTIVLTLPGELSVFDIGHFGVWCEAFTVDFGHVKLPPSLLQHVPPSLKMLGVSPQSRNKALAPAPATVSPRAPPPRRRPPARLEATTYRPPLRLRPGAAPVDGNPAPHTSLHRRADTYTPPKQQLLDHQSKDEKETQSEEKQTLKDEQETNAQNEAVSELPVVRTQQAHNAQKTHQHPHIHNQQTVPQQYYQQQQSQEIYQEHYQEPEYLQPQQHLYPYIPGPGFQNPIHQPQIFDARAFELLNRQYQPQPVLYHPQTAQYQQQPVQFHPQQFHPQQFQPQQFQPQPEQYRLVPYKYQ